jgi:dTDP-4-amino-4,6-dideoxygalactose transaminase
VPKDVFGEALAAEGVWNNCDYDFLVAEWPSIQDHLARPAKTPNAAAFRHCSFNVLLNERFDDDDVRSIIEAILKVEGALAA